MQWNLYFDRNDLILSKYIPGLINESQVFVNQTGEVIEAWIEFPGEELCKVRDLLTSKVDSAAPIQVMNYYNVKNISSCN